MKKFTSLSRRQFLSSVGVSAAAAPFLPLLESGAEGAGYPKRLILFFAPHGFLPGMWAPTTSGANYTVGPVLQPLNPWLNRITVTQGLSFAPANVESHHSGLYRCWTGTDDNPGPSIDQLIAAKIGTTTAFPSIQLGVPHDDYGISMIWSSPNQQLIAEFDPASAVSRIFPTTNSTKSTNRSRIADMLKGELAAIRSRISAADYAKVDGHLSGLNALQQQVQSCSATVPQVSYAAFPDGENNVPAILQNQMQIITSAFTCDLTRVASIQSIGLVDDSTFDFLGTLQTTDGHHSITHNSGETGGMAALQTIQTFYATQFAKLLSMLDAVPEGAGTMLDNTLVVWGTELSDAISHSNHNMPYILAGGAGGAFNTGISLQCSTSLTPHRLLVSICQGFGVNINTISNQDPGSGPLPGLLASS